MYSKAPSIKGAEIGCSVLFSSRARDEICLVLDRVLRQLFLCVTHKYAFIQVVVIAAASQ